MTGEWPAWQIFSRLHNQCVSARRSLFAGSQQIPRHETMNEVMLLFCDNAMTHCDDELTRAPGAAHASVNPC